jgi:hypothetical protein
MSIPLRHLLALTLALAASLAGGAAHAWQDMAAANRAFDERMARDLGRMQAQNQASQRQLWQRHLQVNGPRLRAQYQQLLASGQRGITFEQFAYWDLMTAAGTNVPGAQAAQRRQFEGNQAAYRTVQQGHDSYNAGWRSTSQRQSDAVARYSNEAIRGNAPYVDPATGRSYNLPHSLPAGQVHRAGDEYVVQDRGGNYFRWTNTGWTPMHPR